MVAIKDEAVASLETLLQNLQLDEVELVAKTLKELQEAPVLSEKNSLLQSLAGRTYSQREKIQLELKTLFRYFEQRRQLLEGALTASEVAKLFNTSRQTPHDRMKSQTLLGVLDRGAYRFPVVQFDPEAPDGVLDGLPEVLKALEISDFAKLNWLTRSNPFLDGLTPAQALKKGDKERVIDEARGVGTR